MATTFYAFDHSRQTITQNITKLASSGSADFLDATTSMLWRTVPMVLLVGGTFGNVMIVVVMRRMRASQSTACLSVYFTALALSDQCLLTSVLWFWVDAVFTWPPSYYRYDLLCTVTYFVWYTTTQTSAWFLVAMTYQRVTSVVAPHRVAVLCTVRRGKIVTTTIVTVAFLLNFHFLFTFVYSHHHGGCVSQEKYSYFVDIFTVLDLFIASVVPFLLLFIGNSILIAQVVKSSNMSAKFQGHVSSDASASSSSGRNQIYPMTRTLILTSTAFLMLTLPICIFDAYRRTVNTEVSGDEYFHAVLNLAEAVTQLMWFTASASNFYLYLLSGKKFREAAKRLLRCQNVSVNQVKSMSVSSSVAKT